MNNRYFFSVLFCILVLNASIKGQIVIRDSIDIVQNCEDVDSLGQLMEFIFAKNSPMDSDQIQTVKYLTTYEKLYTGRINYVVVGKNPDEPTWVRFTVEEPTWLHTTNEDSLIVAPLGEEIELIVTEPLAGAPDLIIENVPSMPHDICKAYLKNYKKGIVQYLWEYKVECTLPTRTERHIFQGNSTAMNANPTTWNQNNDNIFIGGDVSIHVLAEADKQYIYDASNIRRIKGENPTPEQARAGVGLEIQVIMYHESRFRQFNSNGNPLYGPPGGYGIGQIDNPPATVHELWNWPANRSRCIAVFNEKRNWGLGYPGRLRNLAQSGQLPPCYLNVTEFTTNEQILKEAFQLYNRGHQWQWIPVGEPEDPNTGGQWIPRPGRSGYGDNAWDTYQSPPWN
ncbi:hypothetical protein JW835_13860 [bacterium]|nr:hypothetical protein [bacterium]